MSIYDHLEYRLLKYLLAVAEKGTFTAAAVKLAVFQPALSTQIGTLESVLGFKIFDRENGNAPTPEGAVLLHFALESLQSRENVIETIRAIHTGSLMPLRMGFSAFVEKGLLGTVTQAYKDLLPNCAVLPEAGDTDELVQRVRDDSLDTALVTLPVNEDGLQVNVLNRDRLLVSMRSDDPLAECDAVPSSALNGKLSIFSYQRHHPAAYARILRVLEEHGITLRPCQPTMNLEHVHWLVKEGHCYTLVRESRQLANGLVARPVTDIEWTIDTVLITKTDDPHPALSLLILELTKNYHPSTQTHEMQQHPHKSAGTPVHGKTKSNERQLGLFRDHPVSEGKDHSSKL
jgi:DNA-binding transcriptional LysR family regulator